MSKSESGKSLAALAALQKAIHATAVVKGWWPKAHDTAGRNMGEIIANIHSEISEAWEHYRGGNGGHPLSRVWQDESGKPDGFAIELADAIIRILDLAEAMHCDMGATIEAKMAYNRTREYRHGGKKA